MKAVALLLLAGVFLRHDTAFQVAALTGWSAGGVFYVAGALWEAMLCALVLLLLTEFGHWRSLWLDLARAAMAIGIVEASMNAVGQMLISVRPPPNTTQLDFVTGFPVYWTTLALELGVVAIIIGAWAGGWRHA